MKPSRRLSQFRTLPAGAVLVPAGAECLVLVVRGACEVRTLAGAKIEVLAAGELAAPGTARPIDRSVARALELMRARLDSRLDVQELARAVGLSRAAFARRFRQATRTSPRRHLTELRLSHAAALLRSTDESMAEIARRVGYGSEFAFARAFKRLHGVTPGTFRRAAWTASPITMLRAA